MRSRSFLLAAVGVLLAQPTVEPAAAQDRGDCRGQVAESSAIVITGPEEPGDSLVVEGRVLTADGKVGVPGVTVFVFHTDAAGYYSPGGMDESSARLCGLMLTDSAGRYRFDTVKPGHYATGGPPAHVHYRVWGPGVPRQSFTLNFEADPLLGERGENAASNPTWATIRPLEGDAASGLRVVRDLRLR